MGIYETKKRAAPERTKGGHSPAQSKSSPYGGMMQMASQIGNSGMQEYLRQQSAPQSNAFSSQSGGQELPPSLRERTEARTGIPLDDVRVHYNSDKPAKLGALAYARGSEVHIGPGQEKHLEHELGHVAQQKAGLVQPTEHINNLQINTDETLEADADKGFQVDNFVSKHSANQTQSDAVIQMCGVKPKGRKRKNHYIQYENGSIIKQRNSPTEEEHGTTEEGYTEFCSCLPAPTAEVSATEVPAAEYSSLFITSQDNPGQVTYKKAVPSGRRTPIKLPVSCIEAAQWAMHLMLHANDDVFEPVDYPGYAEGQKLTPDTTTTLVGKEGEGDNPSLDIDAEEGVSKQTLQPIGNVAGYKDDTDFSGFNVGDGLFAYDAASKNDPPPFHAVAIIAKFPNGGVIVIERNAGRTAIPEGHQGDTNWLMNYYANPQAFTGSMSYQMPHLLKIKSERTTPPDPATEPPVAKRVRRK